MRAFADGAAAPQSAEVCALCLRAYYPDDPAMAAIFDAFADILFACGDLNQAGHRSAWLVGSGLALSEDTTPAISVRR